MKRKQDQVLSQLLPLNAVKNRGTEINASGMKKSGRKKGVLLLRVLFLNFLLCQMAACATMTEFPPEKKPTIALQQSLSFPDYSADDRKLFEEGLNCLKTIPERLPDYTKARKILETLVQKHPESKWRIQAELWLGHLDAFSRLEEKLNTCQQKVENNQIAQNRLQRENEQLRKEIRELTEKTQEELNRFNQENEQLKRDIRLLKNMEIQREKRERMLR